MDSRPFAREEKIQLPGEMVQLKFLPIGPGGSTDIKNIQ